jgi:hypothetical protein
MSLDPDLAVLMAEPIAWEASLGKDSHGAHTYAVPKVALGRVEEQVKVVKDPTNGKEVVSKTTLLLQPTLSDGTAFVPTAADRFTLGAGYQQPQTPVILVSRVNDEAGLNHYVVAL